jgi:hypothetical protein
MSGADRPAVTYLRDHAGGHHPRVKTIYEGLIDVLEPRDRRHRIERRGRSDRRLANLGPPGSIERRGSSERRGGSDRRHKT